MKSLSTAASRSRHQAMSSAAPPACICWSLAPRVLSMLTSDPFFPRQPREALQKGTSGSDRRSYDDGARQTYLLARELTLGNRTVMVRSQRGALVRVHATHAHYANTKPGAKARNQSCRKRRCTMTFRKSILLLISLTMIAALVACSSSSTTTTTSPSSSPNRSLGRWQLRIFPGWIR